MTDTIQTLSFLRNQLVTQQAIINESISRIDSILLSEIEQKSISNISINSMAAEYKKFPVNVISKRDKLKYILKQSDMPLTAKEIKEHLREYNEVLPNVDQSLVNLEQASLISSKNEIGRKQYFIEN